MAAGAFTAVLAFHGPPAACAFLRRVWRGDDPGRHLGIEPFPSAAFCAPRYGLLDTVTAYRKKERGPRLVAIGGGTGLACLLRGLKAHTHNLTAIVTVADDGGSSGELRRSRGILPPGDIRHCLTALSNDEADAFADLPVPVFSRGWPEGHSLGNLFITALADITGSFEEAVAESGRVLAVQGRVLPATLHDVRLVADVQLPDKKGDVRVKGESQIPKSSGQVRRIWLEPNNPAGLSARHSGNPGADLIVIGPGSLYTSLLPNLLVPDIAEAIRASRALKFYVCNVATQPGETDGFSCGDHVRNIEKHLGGHFFDLMICNNRYNGKLLDGVSIGYARKQTWKKNMPFILPTWSTANIHGGTIRTSWPRRSWTCITNAQAR